MIRPDFSFQKCIPEDENAENVASLSTVETNFTGPKPSDMPTRRILRRHEKTSNHDHVSRNGMNDDSNNPQSSSSSNKYQSSSRPYSERVSHYAETRARIFNESSTVNMDGSNPSTTTKLNKSNSKQQSNSARTSYRKQQQQQQQQQNNTYQNRSFTYQQSQVPPSNNQIQHYGAGKHIDPSSHLINTSTNRSEFFVFE